MNSRYLRDLSLNGASDSALLIGIDFGTTFSGVAWAWSKRLENINVVTNWDSVLYLNKENEKAPSEIYYGEGTEEVSWGYGIPLEAEPLKWFKLLLVDEGDLQEDVRKSHQIKRAREMLANHRKTAVEVVADYLRLLWKHVIKTIERERGSNSASRLPFRVVLTVPAIWPHNAQQRMREAASKAGILDPRTCGETTLRLVPEPEAAALASLSEFRDREDVQVGEVFVVCDAGGGTVDIISYEIESTAPVVLKECVEGDGKLCGAIFLDEEFEKFIRQAMGKNWTELSQGSIRKLMNDEWENGIKRSFDDDEKKTWTVSVPPDYFSSFRTRMSRHPLERSRGDVPMSSGQFRLSREHLRPIFEKVTLQIRKLVNNQIKAVIAKKCRCPSAIILVGGFGRCRALYQLLREEHSENGIEVLQPSGARP